MLSLVMLIGVTTPCPTWHMSSSCLPARRP
ncbi:hypothetical protein LEMLEM_LOCUS12045 [Lemmus lemmus]